ncbi:MAG: AAA family ATPase [Isosphaeraceae bacterium]
MKILNLRLQAVGPFSGVELAFSRCNQGLQLVYGPNEAGKSSALRALSYLLFGFPRLSADCFIHPNEHLRVGGKLVRDDGEELEFVRRRGNQNTLRGLDDSSVVPDERLARFLGGLNRDTFEALFGIDHERLTQAGEEIRTGHGQLGELLFAAGSGLAGLRQAQEKLQQELEALFKPQGKNPRINKTLAEFRESQDELKRNQLSSNEWLEHDREYHEALSKAAGLHEEVRAARAEHGQITRIRQAIPLVARRRLLLQQLAELGDVVRLREDFGAEFRETQNKLGLAEQTIKQTRLEIADIDARLDQLDLPRLLLDAGPEIEALQERLGAVEKATLDRIRIENFRDDSEHQSRRILRELGHPAELDRAESLRLRIDEPMVIRQLGQRSAQLRGQAEEARRTIVRHQDQIERFDKASTDLEQPRDVEPLRVVVRRARKAGDLDARLAEARGRLARVEKKASLTLSQLPGWSRSPEDLQRLSVPLGATLDQFEARFQAIAQERQSIDERLAAEEISIRQIESMLQTLELQQDVPTEEALEAARKRRDLGWQLVKAGWLEMKVVQEKIAAFLADFPPADNLAVAYEQAVDRCDVLADRLRREADRVARKAEVLASLHRHQAARHASETDVKQLDHQERDLQLEWAKLVEPLGIMTQCQTPAELRAWARSRDEVIQLLEKVEEARQDVEPLEQAFETHQVALKRFTADLGELPSASDCDLAGLLDRAETIIKQQDDLIQKRSKLETKRDGVRSELAAAQLSLREAEADLDTWRGEWAAKMVRIGLEPAAAPEQAEVVLTRTYELFECLEKRRDHLSRIRGIDRDAELFARDVGSLVVRIAAELGNQPTGDQARELFRLLREARSAAQTHATLLEQRNRAESKLQDAETRCGAARISLERHCQEAGCTDIDQLPEAQRRSQDSTRLETDLAACTEQLLVEAAGADIGDFAAQVERADSSALESSIKELEDKIASHEEELRRLDQTIGTKRAELARMDGSDRAAECAEKIQTLVVRLQGDAARYAALKLAATVLHKGIERYREKNQGPILARASTLFAALTGGSFTRLQIDDDDGRSVLKGVRPDGRLVGTDGMSDGSHDQLYLALRLASLESWLDAHESVPFVVDDILLNFDDERATAALRELAGLSRRTQVLFFTHHRHIIDLARAELSDDLVFVHELPEPRFRETRTFLDLRKTKIEPIEDERR